MYLKRLAEAALREIISGDKVGIILGASQVGKTTLIKQVVQRQKTVLLNFDAEVDKVRFQAAAALPPSDALDSLGNPQVLVIDEAQRLPEASRIIKGWYDAHLLVKILLLGSSSLDLLDQAVEGLTGRNRKLILPPLLFSETLAAQAWATPPDTARSTAPTFCPAAAGFTAATVGLRRLSRGCPDPPIRCACCAN